MVFIVGPSAKHNCWGTSMEPQVAAVWYLSVGVTTYSLQKGDNSSQVDSRWAGRTVSSMEDNVLAQPKSCAGLSNSFSNSASAS